MTQIKIKAALEEEEEGEEEESLIRRYTTSSSFKLPKYDPQKTRATLLDTGQVDKKNHVSNCFTDNAIWKIVKLLPSDIF